MAVKLNKKGFKILKTLKFVFKLIGFPFHSLYPFCLKIDYLYGKHFITSLRFCY